MKCFVDDHEIACQNIGPPPLNYGQHWRYAGYPKRRYRYVLEVEEFARTVSQPFAEATREIVADMKVSPDDWALSEFLQFTDLKCPSLSALIANHPDLLSALMKWLEFDLLNWLEQMASPPHAGRRYSANTVDEFIVMAGTVQIEGIAYDMALDGPQKRIASIWED